MAITDNQPYSLDGKVALITGASRGIGRGIALELSRRGASVIVNYNRSSAAAHALVAEIEQQPSHHHPSSSSPPPIVHRQPRAIAVQADVSKTCEVAALFETALGRFDGRLDVVVSNAGTELFRAVDDVSEEDFDRVFGLNARAQFFVAQRALRCLPPGGRVVLTSSVAANIRGVVDHALYAGSKAAVEGFARSLAVDAGRRGVTVNAIAPGGVKTDMYDENAWRYSPGATATTSMAEIDKGLAGCCPLNRVAVSQDIARVVAFLAHPDSEWINGQVISLTGGSWA